MWFFAFHAKTPLKKPTLSFEKNQNQLWYRINHFIALKVLLDFNPAFHFSLSDLGSVQKLRMFEGDTCMVFFR